MSKTKIEFKGANYGDLYQCVKKTFNVEVKPEYEDEFKYDPSLDYYFDSYS